MFIRWIGAALVIAGCGGWGFQIAASYRRQISLIRKMTRAVEAMQWELKYRLTALPDLCRMAAKEVNGPLRNVFRELAAEMEANRHPAVSGCMDAVLRKHGTLPGRVRKLLKHLGRSLGRFDLEGQIQGLESILCECAYEQQCLEKDQDSRMKNYRTLGICTGAALVILFI